MAIVLVGLDLETTGVDIEKSQPVQMASAFTVLREGSSSPLKVLFNSLCNPTVEIEPGAQEVHGISEDMVRYSPLPKTAAISMALAIGAAEVVGELYTISYNGKAFDLPILNRYDKRYYTHKHIDVFVLCLRELHHHGTKLTDLYRSYIGKEPDNAHDAAVDCILVLEVLVKYLEETGKTVQGLFEELDQPRAYAVFPFGKHKGKELDAVPSGYAVWCLKNFDNITPDLQLTLDYIAGKG